EDELPSVRVSDPGESGGRMQGEDRLVPPSPPPPSSTSPLSRSRLEKDFLEAPFRIFLLDMERQPIFGRPQPSDEIVMREITLQGKPIGWLGVNKGPPRLTPSEIAFLERQNELFYLIGCGIFLLTAVVSFFLSRNLLAPIKELTDGTRALTRRKFSTRIEVRSRDELGQLAADFNVMAQTLEQYEEMRKQWISDISHELRTPLSILRGEIEAMQDGVRDLDLQALDSVYAEVLHLGKIVADLHELSLADAGALNMDRRLLDPIQVLRETLRLFHTRFEQSQIAILDNLNDSRQVTLWGDPVRLSQLFANILENTLRYADAPGDLRLIQNVSATELTLIFEDSGPGVPEESVDRLFDRLYRADSARTRSKGGSGLGLAICKSIVESHGGTISAENAASRGLRIKIVVPLAAVGTDEKQRRPRDQQYLDS
ncbi:MAG: ATP-binding protein, partial [Desulforhabdus sp.]|nr:ATP-binding protein [Desulforhabdus sp.]